MSGRFKRWFWLLLLTATLAGCQGFEYKIPVPREGPGVYHTVREGQTLYAIAQTYSSDVRLLQAVNGIKDPDRIRPGQRLWIPFALRVLEVPATGSRRPRVAGKAHPPSRKKSARRKAAPVRPGYLGWPVKGVVTSGFGRRRGRNHEGIDIGAKSGTPIRAAAAGEVKFSGWGPTGYGKMIIIKHPNELTTVYAHNSRNLVPKGRKVSKGQIIGLVGSTGRSTGPHLHFEVRNHTHPKDPIRYLPPRK